MSSPGKTVHPGSVGLRHMADFSERGKVIQQGPYAVFTSLEPARMRMYVEQVAI